MGKLALLLAFAFAVAGGSALLTVRDADVRASSAQGAHEADVIAREVALSAYNGGTADLRAHGNDLAAGLAAFGAPATDCAGGRASCYRREGRIAGGTYLAEAAPRGGSGVDVYVRGVFEGPGGVEEVHVIEESIAFDVLGVNPSLPAGQCGEVRVTFLESRASHCAAVLVQETHDGVTGEPRMVYPPGHDRDGDRNDGFARLVAPGTRLNVGIAVDDDCRGAGSRPTSHQALTKDAADQIRWERGPAALRAEMDRYAYRADDWAWTRWALASPDAGSVFGTGGGEGPWAMVEADPSNPQRWRVAFEDKPAWDVAPGEPGYTDPRVSLAATKRFGYDRRGNDGRGDGWDDRESVSVVGPRVVRTSGPDGFHDLRDSGSTPDFSDQVVLVEVVPAAGTCPSVAAPPTPGTRPGKGGGGGGGSQTVGSGGHDGQGEVDPSAGEGRDTGGRDKGGDAGDRPQRVEWGGGSNGPGAVDPSASGR